jgi:F-type H+-transporting ATPase subunit b
MDVLGINTILEAAAEVNDKADLYPHWQELLVGAIAFAVLFFFTWKWVLPRINVLLEERRQKIQGELERAEAAKREADAVLDQYREQLARAKEEANGILEEARRTAEQLRKDLMAKAEQEAQATGARAQDEIRAERDRVFAELRGQVAEIAVELAGRVVGEELDRSRHERLIQDYIDQVAQRANGSSH